MSLVIRGVIKERTLRVRIFFSYLVTRIGNRGDAGMRIVITSFSGKLIQERENQISLC